MRNQLNRLNRLLLPSILILLVYGFWISREFSTLAAGVAIFLFGMIYLEQGFKLYTGGLLESLLRRTTNRVWKSLSFGVISTSLLQSSSLVSVVAISFLSASLIDLTAGIGIILGANLGSTTGAWLIAVFGMNMNLSASAMPLLVIGLILKIQSCNNLKGLGYILFGVGFLFLGVHYMKEGFEILASSVDVSVFALEGLVGLLVYTGVGIVVTIIMQSTNATLVLAFAALASGQLTYDNAIAVVIGSNVGTTVTAILGAISASSDGKRLAAAHLLFNVITSIVAIALLSPLQELVDRLAELLSFRQDQYAVKLAIFHSLFNLVGIVVFLPFLGRFVNHLNTLFAAKENDTPLNLAEEDGVSVDRAVYLNPVTLGHPDTALRAVTRECARLYRNTLEIICYSLYLTGEKLRESDDLESLVREWRREDTPWTIKALYHRHIKGIYADILRYSGILEGHLPAQQARELFALRVACRDFVQAIKQIKHTYRNMGRYTTSTDDVIREQYNQLRFRLASVLKQVDELGVRRNYSDIDERIKQLRQELEEQDRSTHKTLNTMIRSDRLDPFVISSLMNDTVHIRDACSSLIDGAVVMLSRDKLECLDLEVSPEFARSQLSN